MAKRLFAVVEEKVEKAQKMGLPLMNRATMVGFYAKMTHDLLTAKAAGKDVEPVPEALRNLAADTLLENFRRQLNDKEFERFRETFERDYRPKWMVYAEWNPGAVFYCLAQMAHSDFILPFWLDILEGRLGQASTAPFFVLRSFDDEMYPVQESDIAFHTCYADRNFVGMRTRAAIEHAEILKLAENGGRVAFLGGGLAPVTWAFGPLPDNIQMVIFDKEDYTARLAELLEVERLDEAQITYEVGSFSETVCCADYINSFDIVVIDGVLAYFHGRESEVLALAHRMLKAEGEVICDLQVNAPENALDALILGWPQTMYCYDNYGEAEAAMNDFAKATGFRIQKNSQEYTKPEPFDDPKLDAANLTFILEIAEVAIPATPETDADEATETT